MTTNKHDRKEGQLVTAVWRNGVFSASYDSFLLGSSAVLRLNSCAKFRHYAKPKTVNSTNTFINNQNRTSKNIYMEQKKPSIFELAKPAPAPTEDQAFDNALHAVQIYLNMIITDEDKITEFNDIVDSFCWEAKKKK